ncbi:MAG TPA: hypothetical protein VFY29_05020 [Terriglobia bacterium]|nr:hypothetical protein [Terriglobia bacterium]
MDPGDGNFLTRPALRPGRLSFLITLLLVTALASCNHRTRHVALPPIGSPPPVVNLPQPPKSEIAILFNGKEGYATVATELKKILAGKPYNVVFLNIDTEDPQRMVRSLSGKAGLVTVAVGLPAARFARDRLRGPMVFAQVFNYRELLIEGRTVRGVKAIPPLALQVRDWKKLDPKLRRVGLIVSERHEELIREAEEAGQSASVTIRHEVSSSDRETLYLFKRLAPQIDGLWLLPDDQILSPTVLRELMAYAEGHGVRVCAFSDALLPMGALISASPPPAEIARTILRVLEGMAEGSSTPLPSMTSVPDMLVRVNPEVAGRLGLKAPGESWTVRGSR